MTRLLPTARTLQSLFPYQKSRTLDEWPQHASCWLCSGTCPTLPENSLTVVLFEKLVSSILDRVTLILSFLKWVGTERCLRRSLGHS